MFYDNEYPVLSLKLVNLAQKPLEESFFLVCNVGFKTLSRRDLFECKLLFPFLM